MKNCIVVLFALFAASLSAQKVKLKKDKIYFDGNEVMTYQKIDMNTIVISGLEGHEIIQLSRHDNETDTLDDDYVKMYFLDAKLKLESNSLGRRNWEAYIEWLAKNKVFSADGTFNAEKVASIVDRYDENITARTVRH